VSRVKPTFFRSAAEFRRWLDKHRSTAPELLVGFYKRGSGRPSMTWPESVDEALCFGWIDGVRRRIDDERYCIRFTPRRQGSIWSVVNTRRVAALTRDGRMHESGLRAFRERDERKTKQYSFERGTAALTPSLERRFRANAAAWEFFTEVAPYYRRMCTHWVISAKQDATRERRLALLIDASARREKIDFMKPRKRSHDEKQ
jgi:uncharacterized protein YdeI (YjbR/CyaY-like superfamily)